MSRRERQASTAQKGAPGYFAYSVFAVGLIAGIALGLAVTRIHGPLQRSKSETWQLRAVDGNHYQIAIALEYAHRGDLPKALAKLIAMRPAHDPLAALAEAACALGSSGYLRSESGINALSSAVSLYASQGRAGCAEELLPQEATEAAPDEEIERAPNAGYATPLPTKPPLPEAGAPISRHAPTPVPRRSFEARSARSHCETAAPALIHVRVVDYLGRGIPGQRIRVRWGEQEDIFISGLKVDRGDDYADFQMDEGLEYAIDMPGAAEPLGASLSTSACYSEGRRALTSWRVTFVEI